MFDPVEFLERLAVLVPRPRVNLILYYGVLGAGRPLHLRGRRSSKFVRALQKATRKEEVEMKGVTAGLIPDGPPIVKWIYRRSAAFSICRIARRWLRPATSSRSSSL